MSTVSSWTTKDNSDKVQGPLTVKIALLMLRMLDFLLSTELLKLFILQRLVSDHPALLAASLRHVILDVRLLSAGSCPTWPGQPLTRVPKRKLETSRSANLPL